MVFGAVGHAAGGCEFPRIYNRRFVHARFIHSNTAVHTATKLLTLEPDFLVAPLRGIEQFPTDRSFPAVLEDWGRGSDGYDDLIESVMACKIWKKLHQKAVDSFTSF